MLCTDTWHMTEYYMKYPLRPKYLDMWRLTIFQVNARRLPINFKMFKHAHLCAINQMMVVVCLTHAIPLQPTETQKKKKL